MSQRRNDNTNDIALGTTSIEIDVSDASDRTSMELAAQLEKELDEGVLDIACHAQLRAKKLGHVNLIANVLVPLADLIRHPIPPAWAKSTSRENSEPGTE